MLPSNRGLDYGVDFHSFAVLHSGVILKAEEMSLFYFIKYFCSGEQEGMGHIYSHFACVLVQFSLG